jgi:hypothetical protein
MFYYNIRANLALIILLCSEMLSPQKKKLEFVFGKI